MNPQQVKNIVEAALLAAETPLSVDQLLALFEADQRPERGSVREVLENLQAECEGRGIELRQVGSGYRYQVRATLGPWISKLWAERPPRYSRALLETLALIVYRQPITRADIEDVRGVTVSTAIIRTLLDREWVRIVGYRDVPGRPALYGTTRKFLDHFNLKSLEELPPLTDIIEIEEIGKQLDLQIAASNTQVAEAEEGDALGEEAEDADPVAGDSGGVSRERSFPPPLP